MNICDRHASKERRQISVFRHWRFVAIRAVEAAHTYSRASSATMKLEFPSRVLAYYRDRIFRQRCVFCWSRWRKSKRRGDGRERRSRGKDTEAAIAHEEEGDEEVDAAGRRRSKRRRGRGPGRTPMVRRRYATEYHYPDNGPAISSTACINLRVKGQDTRYLNK